jgi:SAM-dependent methyltransferase
VERVLGQAAVNPVTFAVVPCQSFAVGGNWVTSLAGQSRQASSVQSLSSASVGDWIQHLGFTKGRDMIARPRYLLLVAALAAAYLFTAVDTARAQLVKSADEKTATEPRRPDVIYVPTPQGVVEKMLELAEVKKGDVVYDLGCGDGRIVVTAAKKYGVKAFGFDIDPQRVKEAVENVKKNKVEDLVTIKQADIFTLDLSKANVVTLYLLPSLNVKLMPQLRKLKPGSRIVSHDFAMEGAKPVLTHQMSAPYGDSSSSSNDTFMAQHTIYKWVVPWQPEKPAGETDTQK